MFLRFFLDIKFCQNNKDCLELLIDSLESQTDDLDLSGYHDKFLSRQLVKYPDNQRSQIDCFYIKIDKQIVQITR